MSSEHKYESTGSGDSNIPLFDPDRLSKLSNWSKISSELDELDLLVRPLRRLDYQHGYLNLLSELTHVGQISSHQFEQRFDQMKLVNAIQDHYAIVVIVEKSSQKIVGATTLFIELKFIHECATRGRIEDVAVLSTHRGRRIGEIVVKVATELAKESYKCYKLSLDCTDDLKKFYLKNNFKEGCNTMVIRFNA